MRVGGKCASSKYSRIYARISHIRANMQICASMCIEKMWRMAIPRKKALNKGCYICFCTKAYFQHSMFTIYSHGQFCHFVRFEVLVRTGNHPKVLKSTLDMVLLLNSEYKFYGNRWCSDTLLSIPSLICGDNFSEWFSVHSGRLKRQMSALQQRQLSTLHQIRILKNVLHIFLKAVK